MKVYLVGGAIRDKILNLPVKDRDWVVVHSTPKILLKKKYKQVGKDFPVFLHPKTGEEYALARTERKHGKGYTGFLFHYSKKVTLKEDLKRRDLTINAIAQDKKGYYIDYFNGLKDLKKKVLRHVSLAFQDDPLRVLRVARFLSIFANLGFYIASKTINLMHLMVEKKELLYLTPSRVWIETKKAIESSSPHVYFQVLKRCNALSVVFPEIDKLYFLNGSFVDGFQFYNIGELMEISLARLSKYKTSLSIRFAFICHFFRFFFIKKRSHLSYFFYDRDSAFFTKYFCNKLNVPNRIKKLAVLYTGFSSFLSVIYTRSSVDIVKMLNYIDVWRNPKIIKKFSFLVDFYFFLFNKKKKSFVFVKNFLIKVFLELKKISVKKILNDGWKGIEIKKQLMKKRIQKLKKIRVFFKKKYKNKIF